MDGEQGKLKPGQKIKMAGMLDKTRKKSFFIEDKDYALHTLIPSSVRWNATLSVVIMILSHLVTVHVE